MTRIREKIRNLTLLQYSLLTFALTVTFVILSGIFLTRISFNHLLKVHVDLYPTISEILLRNHPEIEDVLQSGATPTDQQLDFTSIFTPLLHSSSIFRIKIWDTDYTLVWSDEKEIQGQRFPDNDDLTEALSGKMTYSLGEASARENAAESGQGIVLECYIPLTTSGGGVFGAFEFYERSTDLAKLVRTNRNSIWLGALLFFIILYSAFFLIFYDSNSFNMKLIKNLNDTQDVTIFALAYQAEMRDNATGRHIERTTEYVRLLAERLRKFPAYLKYISPEYLKDLVRSAPLHDIGKVGIPDSILLKPGPLSKEEFSLIKTHTTLGAQTLKKAQERLEARSFLEIAIQLAASHHEKWDGSGYPYGLAGENIPLSGRIMAIADVYDALCTRRCYKEPMSHEESIALIIENRGKHFDPQLVDVFLDIADKFKETAAKLLDT